MLLFLANLTCIQIPKEQYLILIPKSQFIRDEVTHFVSEGFTSLDISSSQVFSNIIRDHGSTHYSRHHF